MTNTSLPQFLIIGAQRSGTTSLYKYLRQHPQIFMPEIKEPSFFAVEGQEKAPGYEERITTLDEYEAMFVERDPRHLVAGEASPLYLYSPKARAGISHYLPGVKLLAILRQPADRAFSAFLQHLRKGMEETTDFRTALSGDDHPSWLVDRAASTDMFDDLDSVPLARRDFVKRGFYYRQLLPYFETFGPDSIRVFLQDDLKDPKELLGDVFEFLGVDPSFQPDVSDRFSVGGAPRSRLLNRLLLQENQRGEIAQFARRLAPAKLKAVARRVRNRNLQRPEFDPELRSELTDLYRPDILSLGRLIDRDLSHWLA